MANVIKIELFNEETEKTEVYTAGRISGNVTLKAIEFKIKAESGAENELVQAREMAEFIVTDVFKNQFTVEELYSGLESHVLFPKMGEIIETVLVGKKGLTPPV